MSHPRRVQQINGDEIVNTFDTVTDAGRYVGLTRHAISKVCLGVNKTAGGYVWKFENDDHKHVVVDTSNGKPIYDHTNYFVFDDGKIYNSSRKAFLKPVKNKSGYCYVTLSKSGSKKNHYIHRIVADHYLERLSHHTQVNHKNKQRDDNRLENLEWTSCSENMRHMHTT